MDKKRSLQTATSGWKKIVLALLGIFFLFVLLEVGLRLGGFALLSAQEHGNLRSVKQKGVYRILCLGESTTQGQYPHLLEQVLNQRNIGLHFQVIDEGRSATNTLFILSRIESYLAKYHPDMVVAMMGINDKRIKYYQEIPDADTWIFRHCRVYRFARILFMHILKKIKREDIYGFSRVDLGKKTNPGNAGTSAKKIDLLNEMPAEKAAKLEPKEAEGSHGPRSPFLSPGMISEAQKSFTKIIELDPKNDIAYVGLGKLYLDHGKLPQAEDSFRKAIALNPKNDDAYVGLERFYLDQGELSKAEDSFMKAVELNPKNDAAYVELGRFYRLQNKWSQAADAFKKAIELNPGNDKAYVGLGWFYRDHGEFLQAENSFKKAAELNPGNERNQIVLGAIYRTQGKFPQAEDSFRKAIELNPRDDFAFLELGGLYREQGKFSQAEDVFRKAIERYPKSESLLGALSSLYEEMGKPELASEYAEKAARPESENYAAVTANNYRELKRILDKRGIKLVCVQYPMRNAQPLMNIFEKNEGVIFVDNESLFREALRKSNYKEYFSDMFGGDFGHCTQKGNELLAKNIADVILKEVFKK